MADRSKTAKRDRHQASRVSPDEIAERLSTLIASMDDAVIGTDLEGAVNVWNPAAERLYGFSAAEVFGMNAAELTVPEDRKKEIDMIVEKLAAGGTVERFETVRMRKDGTPVDVSLSISFVMNRKSQPIGTLAVAHDITARKRAEARIREARDDLERRVEERTANLRSANRALEREIAERLAAQEELRRSERLAAIGTLAAGIAHEMNNPLGLIRLELHHAREHLGDPAALTESLDEIERDLERCSHIVSGVLRFAREESTEKTTGDLNGVVRSAVASAVANAGATGVRIETFLAEPLPRLRMNAVEVEQVLINLIDNAIQASYAGSTVRVATSAGDDGVRVCVRDRGRGMTETERARACDPFYTTRTHEGGTGLGLSVCHGIVAGHGGALEFNATPGGGTTVLLHFPAAGDTARPAPLT